MKELSAPGGIAPKNSTFPGHTTGWIHSDWEEKQAAAAANAQTITTLFAPKSAALAPLLKIKKMLKTIKSKATVGLDTDLETILIDKDVKMKATEESMAVDLDSNESDSMSINEDVLLEARLLANVVVGSLSMLLLIPLLLLHGDLGDNQLVFPIAAWANQFQLQLKYESVQDALKLLSVEHVQDETLVSFQLHKCHFNIELELLVHRLEATVVAYKFCDQQLNLVMAEIGHLLCPDM
ncbi:hypothetical protein ARMGADRAFT_1084558 [Armillaria gallica]|uniref:Uncharacterized protein n=1 Tax=Armillaria gallica TaxID=47427 RepID=A0A2H3DMD0_ARMGA|nr:hypothetical protein ARMGADRAFT_1084558 [Armillaria gallica]